jgi:hypothetical protein|tara:strand:+ start:2325 stop:2477 length:153 start_codon:yes stop_codon:yes gene_type:complete
MMTTQEKFEYTRGLEKQIEKQEALIEHLRKTILAYSERMETITKIKNLLK